MNIGRVPPFFILSTSSLASSIIVRSAVKSMLNAVTLVPRRLIAAAILPSTFVPIGMSKLSPRVAFIEGAVKKSTFFVGSAIASHTLSSLLFSVRAPTGQLTTH